MNQDFLTKRLADNFRQADATFLTQKDKDDFRRQWVSNVVSQFPTATDGLNTLTGISTLLGEDLTQFHPTQLVDLPSPIPEKEALQTLGEAREDAPLWRKAVADTLGALEWWQNNAVEPSAALVMGTAFALTPGEQDFETRMKIAASEFRSQEAGDFRQDILDVARAARKAYRETDTIRGLKGTMELLFDPLNVVGLGLPGVGANLARRAGMTALIRPLQILSAIDNAPNAAIGKLLSAPKIPFTGVALHPRVGGAHIPGVLDVPGLSKLKQPHWSTQLKETTNQAYAAIAEGVTGAGLTFKDGSVNDTRQFLSNLKPDLFSGSPRSTANLIQHLDEEIEGVATKIDLDSLPSKFSGAADVFQKVIDSFGENADAWAKHVDTLHDLTPQELADNVARRINQVERKAIIESQRTGRQEFFKGVLTKIRDDERWAEGLAKGMDGQLYRMEKIWLNKVEPTVIRPWAVAHLAFAGFPVMNFVEDLGVALVGMGANIFGVDDRVFQHITQDLFGEALPSSQLLHAAENTSSLLRQATGAFDDAPRKGLEGPLSLYMNKIFVETGGRVGRGIQRRAWTSTYLKLFNKELRRRGVDDATINALSHVVKREVPAGLPKSVARDIQAKVWHVYTSGNPEAIRALQETTTATEYLVRFQTDVLSDFPELPPDVRRKLRAYISERGGVTRENFAEIQSDIREQLFNWSRYTPEGVRANMLPVLDSLGKQPIQDAPSALGVFRYLQHVADEVNGLSREIMADASQHVKIAPPNKRDAIWEEAFQKADEITQEVRAAYNSALDRVNNENFQKLISDATPRESAAMRTNIDEIFKSYKEISEVNLRTRGELAQARDRHFSRTDRDTAFYNEWDDITSEIWGRNRLEVSTASDNARQMWNGLFQNVDFHSLSPPQQRAMRAGVEAMLGEVDGTLSQLTNDLKRWDEVRAFSTPGIRPSIDANIETVKKLIAKNKHLKNVYEAELKTVDSAVREFKTPAALREYDREIRVQNRAIRQAREVGEDTSSLEIQLQQLSEERMAAFTEIIPDHLRDQWDEFSSQLIAQQARLRVVRNNPTLAQNTRGEISRIQAEQRRFMARVESGKAHREAREVTAGVQDERLKIAKQILRANDQQVPPNMRRMEEIWNQGIEAGVIDAASDDLARDMLNPENFADIYSLVVANSTPPALSLREQALLREIQTVGDIPQSEAFVSLLERGLIGSPQKLRNGMFRVNITDEGLEQLDRLPSVIDTEELLSDLPDYVREYENVIDAQVANMDEVFDRMLKLADNPPIAREQQDQISNYFGRMAKELENSPTFVEAAKGARQDAAIATNKEFKKFFIDYDDRSTGDFIMQRMMPFWMYESRRWPRLINLAAKRPVLAKHFAMVGGEWDYGYNPLPWGGLEVNPAKGTIVGGLRRTLSRDFPEMHSGYRGQVEEGLDWMGRFGFYFTPPVTTAVNVLNGELAGNLPAPLTTLLYGVGSFTDLPAGFDEIAYQSRYVDFIVNTAIVDKYGKSATDVRTAAEQGDEEAVATMFLAKREAAKRLFAITQSSIVRYRPEVVRDFKGDVEDAVSQVSGLSKSNLEELDRLGVPYWSVLPLSGFQRKAIREMVGEESYNVLVSRSIALRPVEEQKALRVVDEFWRRHEQVQTQFEGDMLLLDAEFRDGRISGPQARRGYKDLLSRRAFAFDTIKSDPRFTDVPVTMQERLEWAKRFNNPPPLIHPVDELQEAYFSLNPESYIDPQTNETDWNAFYTARENLLRQWQDAGPGAARAVDIFTRSLLRGDTALERSLKVSAPKIREYFAVSSQLLANLEQNRPDAAIAYREYRKSLNLAARSFDPRETQRIERQARQLAIAFPQIPMLDMISRRTREQMRTTDPEMARVYATWISNPS